MQSAKFTEVKIFFISFALNTSLLINNFVYMFQNTDFKTKSYYDLNYICFNSGVSLLFLRSTNKGQF